MKEDFMKQLYELNNAEQGYRRLYMANPYDNMDSVSSWDDFIIKYQKHMKNEINIPKKPLSTLHTQLFEDQFFSKDPNIDIPVTGKHTNTVVHPKINPEIDVFMHPRYVPVMLHSLEFVKLSFVLNGNCYFQTKNEKYRLNKGDLVIVAPNIDQSFFCNSDQDIVVNVIMRFSTFRAMFSPLLLEQDKFVDFFTKMLYQKDFSELLIVNCGLDVEISEVIERLIYEARLDLRGRKIILNSLVLLLFGVLVRNHTNDMFVINGTAHSKTISNVVRYINNNSGNITLSELSVQFNLSQGYLSRYLKQETGSSFAVLVRKLKMEKAAHLLINSNLSIEEIINEVGYVDISNFYRSFKRIYGKTPGEFKKMQ